MLTRALRILSGALAVLAVVALAPAQQNPQELSMKRIPTFETDQAQTAKSRASIDAFVKKWKMAPA